MMPSGTYAAAPVFRDAKIITCINITKQNRHHIYNKYNNIHLPPKTFPTHKDFNDITDHSDLKHLTHKKTPVPPVLLSKKTSVPSVLPYKNSCTSCFSSYVANQTD